MTEADYMRVTYDYAMAAGRVLAKVNPALTFVLHLRWRHGQHREARGDVGAREGQDRERPPRAAFEHAFMFRPAMIIPQHGIVSRPRLYRIVYAVLGPLLLALKGALPGIITTTDNVAKAMLRVAADSSAAKKRVLENRDINEIAAGA